MAKDPLLPNPPQDGDAWESLASNLFGVDLNAPTADIVSDEELDALEAEVEPPAPTAVEPAETVSEPAATEDDDPLAAFNAIDDEADEPAVVDRPIDLAPVDAVAPFEPAGEGQPLEADEPVEPEAATDETRLAADRPPDAAEDAYWDPLAAWDWDAKEKPSEVRSDRDGNRRRTRDDDRRKTRPSSRKQEVSTPRESQRAEEKEDVEVKGPGTDARRAADTFDTVSDYRDEYSEDGEFGAGLLDEVSPEQSDQPRNPKRTIPVRGEASESEEPTTAKEPRLPSRKRKPDEAPPQDRTEKDEPVLEIDDDGFGAGLDDDKADDAEAGPKSKEDSPRRPRRRRRRRRSDQKVESPESADEAEPQRDRQPTQVAEDDDDGDADGAESDKADTPYHNIPTWEEAISYLTTAKSTDRSASRSRESSDRKSDSESSSRGGRRRRRRPTR